MDTTKTVAERLQERDARRANAPGCRPVVTETPFTTRTGRRLLYCYQASTGNHAYLDCGTDLVLTDDDARIALGY
jgi:hypothetical protein